MGWPAVAAAAVAGGSGLLSGYMNNREAEKRQREAAEYNTWSYLNRYTWAVQDLQRAGLNPMLAYTNGAGAAPTSSAASSAGYSNPGADAMAAFNATKIASAQEAKMIQETKESIAREKNYDADTLGKLEIPEQIRQQVILAASNAQQSNAMTDKIRAEVEQVENYIQKLKTEIEKDKSNIRLNESHVLANKYLNELRSAESYLTGKKAVNEELHTAPLSAKAKAAARWSAEGGEKMDNIGRFGTNMWKFLLPSFFKGE